MRDFGQWLKNMLAIIGGIWVVCMVAGFFGSIMMNCGKVVYVTAPQPTRPMGGGTGQNPPVIFDDVQGSGAGTPMLQPVRVIPYDVIEANEYGFRRRGYLPPVCVPPQYQPPYRW